MPIYSDLNTYSAKKSVLTNEQSVYQALGNIISTGLTERLFLPEFGWDGDDLLFSFIDESTSRRIMHELVEAIEKWDSRVIIEWGGTSVSPDYDNNKYVVVIAFSIRGLGDSIFEFSGALTGATP